MSDNWIVANLENAFSTWNDKMTEIWSLITTSPQNFKGGAIWGVISGINGGLQAIGFESQPQILCKVFTRPPKWYIIKISFWRF